MNNALAIGYKVQFAGKSVAISGDTTYSQSTVRHSQGVEVLTHEAVNLAMTDMIKRALRKSETRINPDRMDRIAAVIPRPATWRGSPMKRRWNGWSLLI